MSDILAPDGRPARRDPITCTYTKASADHIDLSHIKAQMDEWRDGIDQMEREQLASVVRVLDWLEVMRRTEDLSGWDAVCWSVCMATAEWMRAHLVLSIGDREMMSADDGVIAIRRMEL